MKKAFLLALFLFGLTGPHHDPHAHGRELEDLLPSRKVVVTLPRLEGNFKK